MSDHDHSLETLFAERQQLRVENAQLKADAIVVAAGIDALQNTGGKPSDDFDGCVE